MLRDGAVFASAAILLDRLFGLGDSLLAFFLAEATEFALAFVDPYARVVLQLREVVAGLLDRKSVV